MSIDHKDYKDSIDLILKEVRLEIPEDSHGAIVSKIDGILNWGLQIQAIDTEGLQPTFNVLQNIYPMPMREDEVTENDIAQDILANGPDVEHDHFAILKVIEQ